MIIIMNPYAGGGTAEKKWSRIADTIASNYPGFRLVRCESQYSAWKHISALLATGETEFVAAGGDGTVNALVNSIMICAEPAKLEQVRFGALGLGSSNDFHKPFCAEKMIRGIPCSIDFRNPLTRDIGRLTFDQNGNAITKYFLINASLGITAEANSFFNNPDSILRILKHTSTPVSILYAALRTMLFYDNKELTISSEEYGTRLVEVTNFGIVKNPHFSGSFHFPGNADYRNGKFSIHLFRNMTRMELLRLMRILSNGAAPDSSKAESWTSSSLTVTCEQPFAVEFDGEVIRTSRVEFGIMKQALRVCP